MQYQQHKQVLVPTGSDIEGPFYKPDAPTRLDGKLVADPTLVLRGRVLDTEGNGIAAALDFWQADPQGNYDLNGFNLRGGILTSADGSYVLETIKPGFYKISEPGQPEEFRCSHIHVKVWVDGVMKLMTQLYFAHDKYDDVDHWFDAKRCIHLAEGSLMHASFDFVLA